MAEEVVIKVGVEAKGATNSLKELKRELKEAQAAALNGDGKAAKRVAELKDKMEDLADSVKTLKGSGVERASASLNALGEGFRNFDFDKIKTGFKGIGTAMAAVPIFLLVEGITYLISNFKELSEGNGILAKSLRVVGDIIDTVVESLYLLTDALGLTNSELDKQGEAIKENAEKSQEALNGTIAAYDRQIKAAQAAGKSTVDLEKAKQQAIIDTNKLIAEQIAAFVRAGGELDDEKKKQLTAALETIKSAVNEQQVIEIKQDTEQKKRNEEAYKRKKDLIDKSKEDADKLFEELSKQQDEADKREADRKATELANRQKQLDDLKALSLKRDQEEVAEFMAKEAAIKAERDKADAEFKASENAKLEAQRVGLDAAKGLSEAFFAFQLNGAKGNAQKELEIKKRMFAVDKAFNVARAIQDGIRSVQAALTIPPPGGQILAGVNAALAAANVAKILATKFDGDGSAGSVADIGAGASTAVPTTTAPTVNTAAPTTQASTTFDEQGRNNNFNRVYVVESDISRVQNRVAKLQEQATI